MTIMNEKQPALHGHALKEKRYQLLLVFLLLSIVVVPLFESSLLMDVAANVVLIVAVTAVGEQRRLAVVCAILAAASITAIWMDNWYPLPAVVVPGNVLDLSFFLLVTGAILSSVFRAREISRETVAGAACAYLLIGIIWADVYAILENIVPGSFTTGGIQLAADPGAVIVTAREQLAHFSYFSLVTLSTLGYGDITPVTRPARALASTEAIFGQLYLAVLIARLVGQAISLRRENE